MPRRPREASERGCGARMDEECVLGWKCDWRMVVSPPICAAPVMSRSNGVANPVHFQPMPNAFELFGVDFLVSHEPDGTFQPKLLEFNAEPAIELTGPRLTWILEDLFRSMAKVCVEPFFSDTSKAAEQWEDGETRYHLLKCSTIQVRYSR